MLIFQSKFSCVIFLLFFYCFFHFHFHFKWLRVTKLSKRFITFSFVFIFCIQIIRFIPFHIRSLANKHFVITLIQTIYHTELFYHHFTNKMTNVWQWHCNLKKQKHIITLCLYAKTNKKISQLRIKPKQKKTGHKQAFFLKTRNLYIQISSVYFMFVSIRPPNQKQKKKQCVPNIAWDMQHNKT